MATIRHSGTRAAQHEKFAHWRRDQRRTVYGAARALLANNLQPFDTMELLLNHEKRFWPHLMRVAKEEVGPLSSRRVFAGLAAGLPAQAFSRTRTAMLRAAGMRIGPSSLVQGPLRITGSGNPCEDFSIGAFTLISGALHADVGASVRIGDRVRIGHDVSLLTVDHEVGSEEMRSGRRKYGKIEIGDGAWLASRVVVLPGVRIGAGAVVAAGAVVTRDVPDNTLVAGVPARFVRNLSPDGSLDTASDEAPPTSRRFLRHG
ncbi:MAG: acyltransferase [Polyangiaceae bacterium]